MYLCVCVWAGEGHRPLYMLCCVTVALADVLAVGGVGG